FANNALAADASDTWALDNVPVATVSLNTHTPETNDILTATATKTDADGDPVSLTFVWKVNGTVKRTFTSATALTDTFDLGVAGNGDGNDVVTVEVTPDDGLANGATASDTATVRPFLQVSNFTTTPTGFTIQFSRAVDGSTLNLYDQGGILGPADVTLVGAST